MFVALDIETTGFDPLLDEVIEIAAVRFDRGKTVDTFQTLLNPQREVPRIVEHITGITGAALEKSPLIEDISESLTQFIGDLPIVGHNISFDMNFLNQKGFNFQNVRYDTLDLASLLLPGLPSYSLDTLTRLLAIEHTEKHRALSDTIASQKLFCYLLDRIDELDEKTLTLLQPILAKSSWPPRVIFQQIYEQKYPKGLIPELNGYHHASIATSEVDSSDSNPLILTKEDFIKGLTNTPEVSEALPFLEKILGATTALQPLLCEHPSNVERKKAYMLAGWFLQRTAQKNLVVATTEFMNGFEHTFSPELSHYLGNFSSKPFVIAFLKDPSEYISLERLEKFMDRNSFEDYETTFLLKILLWLQRSSSGILQELNLQGKEFSLREDVCCQTHAIENLEILKEKEFFWKKALNDAQKADLLIINFDFLLQQKLKDHKILPEDALIVLDDAASLEHLTTQRLSLHLGFSSFVKPFEKLLYRLENKEEVITAAALPKEVNNDIQNLESLSPHELLSHLMNRTEIFFGLLGIMAEHKNEYQSGPGFSPLILEPNDKESLEWQKLKSVADFLYALIKVLIDKNIFPEYLEFFEERKRLLATIFSLESQQDDPIKLDRITWIAKTLEGNAYLRSSPRDIGPVFQQYFFDKGQPLALVSSYAKVKNSFALLRQQLAVPERFQETSFEFKLKNPDDFALIVPHDLPKPSHEDHFRVAANIIKDTILQQKGRTVVLFSSKRSLTGTCLQLSPELRSLGYDILAQGLTGGQGKITEYYKQEKDHAALFASPDFWQQLKIPPEDISCLILHKLPFDPPHDPLLKERSQHFIDPFQEYQLPRAVLLLKKTIQHFFQQRTTPATIIVLDSRVFNTSYGKAFLESFPENIVKKTCEYNKLFL